MSSKTARTPGRLAHKRNVRKYWKERAQEVGTHLIYSPENITRMNRGLPPRRLALLRNKKTNETVEFHAPIELHHVFGLKDDTPQEDQTLVELWPWQHSACDPDRKFCWEFVQWVGFQ